MMRVVRTICSVVLLSECHLAESSKASDAIVTNLRKSRQSNALWWRSECYYARTERMIPLATAVGDDKLDGVHACRGMRHLQCEQRT
eukprot:1184010-Prorocentrum_minimum.AAC.3